MAIAVVALATREESMSKTAVHVTTAVSLLVLAGCFQPVGIGAGTGGSTGASSGGSTGTTDHGCLCENGYHETDVPTFCTCVPNSDCTSDQDCPINQTCSLPVCDPPGPCQAGGTCEPVPSACSSDSDCASDEHCVLCPLNGACSFEHATGMCEQVPATCNTDADCGADQQCLPDPGQTCSCPSGEPDCKCVVMTCQAAGCSSDADCPAGQVCENSAFTGGGECVSSGCTTDADCPSGDFCEQTECLVGPCPSICEPKPVDAGPSGCGTDADCPSGEHCDLCPGCPPGAMCDCAANAGVCEPDAIDAGPAGCITNSDCGAGEVCNRPACADTICCDQVPPGMELPCVDDTTAGQCEPAAPTTCSTNSDCPAGEACFLCQGLECNPGICAPVQTYPCGTGSCTAGQVCVTYGGISDATTCVDMPSACTDPDGRAACSCLATSICGAGDNIATADCSGSIPAVNCMYP